MIKKINKRSIGLLAVMLFAYIGLTATDSFAIRKVCWHGGHCRWQWGNCEDFNNSNVNRAWHCVKDFLEMYVNPAKDVIKKNNKGGASIIIGNDNTPIASDKFVNFLKEIENKYPDSKKEDKATQEKIENEIDNFFKNSDDGKVSQENLEKWSKETGLQIVDEGATVTGTITLTRPGKDAKIDIDSKQPITFEWTSTNVKGPYTLKLFEVAKGQTPEQAMKNNKPVFLKEGITATSEKVPYFGINQPGIKIMCVVSCGDVVSPYSAINTTRSNRKFNTGK